MSIHDLFAFLVMAFTTCLTFFTAHWESILVIMALWSIGRYLESMAKCLRMIAQALLFLARKGASDKDADWINL